MLAIDTSTDWAGLAVTNGEAMAELNWLAGRQQTTQVMPRMEYLLEAAAITPAQISAVTVATGPGSFSGLRVGMAIANGLAAATGIPTIGESTLGMTMRPWLPIGRPVIAVVKAGRSRYGWASDDARDSPASGAVADLIDFVRTRPGAIMVGELGEADAVRVREMTEVTVMPHPERLRRAAVLARMGWERWRSGDYEPDQILEPTYLHRT